MFVHGDNLTQKENHTSKYRDEKSRRFCGEIRPVYDKWKAANLDLRGPSSKVTEDDLSIVIKRVRWLAEYKDFIDQQKYAECFDSRSNLHSSVLEEFIYYLFKDLVTEFGEQTLVGKAATFKDMFFMPPSFSEMVQAPFARIEKKDHDFVIGVNCRQELKCEGSEKTETAILQIPAVAIECKTYLDKTMLEGSSTAAEQLKMKNPNAIYLVVAEWLKLTDDINLKKFKVDQIYVLRRQKNTDREYRYLEGYEKKPISPETVWHMYEMVRTHLTQPWIGTVSDRLERGYLL